MPLKTKALKEELELDDDKAVSIINISLQKIEAESTFIAPLLNNELTYNFIDTTVTLEHEGNTIYGKQKFELTGYSTLKDTKEKKNDKIFTANFIIQVSMVVKKTISDEWITLNKTQLERLVTSQSLPFACGLATEISAKLGLPPLTIPFTIYRCELI